MNKIFKILSALPILLSFSFTPAAKVNYASKDFKQGKFYDSTTKLDFTDSTAEEINNYYGSVGTMTGNEMKVYLYSKIATHKADDTDGKKYFLTYSQVSDWYKLTDRNWSISDTVTPETFTLTKDNTYYFYNAYISDSANNDITKAYTNYINSFKADDSLTGIDYTNKKKPNSQIQVDKEHMWAKNHGFKQKDSSGKDIETKGAWTDLHHLVAADHNTNSAGHNDHFFGEVDHNSATTIYNYLADGSQEVSGWLDESSDTFEPTDEWKGDVARCLLYMGTRYSFKLDTNTQEEPYLYLTDDKTYTDDDANRTTKTFHGVQYNLSTLLEWNELDPVSDYEIHRNNLIYKNIQDNRNPYIDHPEWARRVYDTNYVYDADNEKEPTTKADSSSSSPISSSTSPSSSSTNSSSTSIDKTNQTTNKDNDSNDGFHLFNLTKKQTIFLLIAAAALLIIIIVVIGILLSHANAKQKKKAAKMVQKAAKKTIRNNKKNRK
jgi:endonuclease I